MYDYIFVAIKDIWYILLFDSQNLALRKISSNLNISGPQLRKTFSRNINAYVFMIFNLEVADFLWKITYKKPYNSLKYWNRTYIEKTHKCENRISHFHEGEKFASTLQSNVHLKSTGVHDRHDHKILCQKYLKLDRCEIEANSDKDMCEIC